MKLKRYHFICLFITLLAIEIYIALFVHDHLVRPYLGDVLVVILVYTFVRSMTTKKIKRLPLYVFLFASTIEILQLFDLLHLLKIQNRFIHILLGSTFDWFDLACYGIGSILLLIFEMIENF